MLLFLPFQFWIVLFSCSVLAVASTTTTTTTTAIPTDEHGDYDGSDLIEWIRSDPDGIVHPSLRIGREVPGDPTSLMGLFVQRDATTEPIEKGEILAQIPWSRMITPPPEKYSPHRFQSCRAVYELAHELKLGNDSKMAPYVRYLLRQPRGTMPGEWTQAGKDFLRKVTDDGDLPPHDDTWRTVFEDDWVRDCSGNDDDHVERAAYWLASSRDEDTLMVPIYDMANHSNDPKKLNTLSYKPNKAGESFKFVSSRRIMPGEQVYNSYNRCGSCSNVDPDDCETFSYHRTPDLFVNFGFVEDYPQSWWFDPGDDDDDDDSSDDDDGTAFEFCLERGDNDGSSSSGGLPVALWDDEDALPDAEDARWLSMHRRRLKKMSDQKDALEEELVQRGDGSNGDDEEDEKKKKMTRWEWESIWRYHGALYRAIDAAMRSADEASSSDDNDSSDDDESSDDEGDEL